MALKVNSTSPTVIDINQGSDFTIDFPTGAETVPKLSRMGPDGSTIYSYSTTFTQTDSTTYSKYLQLQINGVFLTSTMQEVYKTGNSSSYRSFRALFSNGVLELQQYVYQQGTSSSPSRLNLRGDIYTGTFSPNVSLTVLKYATCGSDLEEATRSSVSSYTSTQLDGWVGLQNDTWSGITNASSLIANKYYYIRVLVSDTNKYGKFCVRFKSYSGQTITVDNIGWGYDGEVIYSTPVWGKPYSLSVTNNSGTGAVNVAVNRTSSPNQHASTGTISAGSNKIYHGDTLSITATPVSGDKLTTFTINGTSYASSQTSAVTKTVTVENAVTVVVAATGNGGKLSMPDIQSASIDYQADSAACVVYIKNTDPRTVTMNVTFYDAEDTIYGEASFSLSGNASKNYWIALNSSGEYASGWYVKAYCTASGHIQSDTDTFLG